MRISIIIPTYGRPERLERATRSLLAQRRPPDELVIVVKSWDVASRTAAERLCCAGSGMAVRIATVEEASIIAAENAGMRAATGDVVCFMDDDAVAPPDWVEQITAYYADPRVGGVGGRDVVRYDGQILACPVRTVGRVGWFGRLVGNHHNETQGARVVDFLKGCNMSFRRGLLEEIDRALMGDFTYGFEIDVSLTVKGKGYRLVYDPAIAVDHYPSRPQAAEATDAQVIHVLNHNQTYVLLKHLGWPRRLAFLAYTFLVGDKTTPGLLRGLWLWARGGAPLGRILAPALRGKVGGVRSFRARALRGQRARAGGCDG